MERYRLEEGIVVGRKPLPQGDLLLRLVTPKGSLEAVVRKGQRPTGRTGRLSLFLHGLEAPRRFLLAAFLAELAYRLASPEAAPRIYPLLVSGLRGIAKHEDPLLPLVWAGWRVAKAGGIGPSLEGEGLRLKGGRLGEEGVYLGREGVEALKATLRLPGAQALPHLEGAPLNRLFLALKAHAEEALGPLRSAEAIGV